MTTEKTSKLIKESVRIIVQSIKQLRGDGKRIMELFQYLDKNAVARELLWDSEKKYQVELIYNSAKRWIELSGSDVTAELKVVVDKLEELMELDEEVKKLIAKDFRLIVKELS